MESISLARSFDKKFNPVAYLPSDKEDKFSVCWTGVCRLRNYISRGNTLVNPPNGAK